MTEFPGGPRRLLALDVGDRRIGIAVSDPTGLLATPIEIYHRQNSARDINHVVDLARLEEAEGLLVGLPINMNGTEGPQAEKVRAFADMLAKEMPVLLWDERLSTIEAERRMIESGRRKRRGVPQHNDAEAAAVILESYLDHVRRAVPR